MRVLHCITSLDVGGSQRQLALLSRMLPRHGWDVHVASLQDGPLAHALDPATTIHFVGHGDAGVPFRLAGLIGRLRPAVVQTWLLRMDVLGGVAALTRAVPWIATERSSALGYPARFSTGMRAVLVRRADALVANSAGGLDLWRRGARPATQRLIRNALDLGAMIAAPDLPGGVTVADGAAVIVCVGRLVAEKGVRVLLQALARVRRDRPAIALLCGVGPLEPELRRLAHDLGIADMVIFAGFVPDVCAVLRRADVFVSVSLAEGSPNAVQEAMACGTPVVLSDIAAHRELADTRTAVFVDGQDATAVADALIGCLRDRPAARARAAHAQTLAQTFAREWPPEAMGAEYDVVYRQVLDSRRLSKP
jgi:glycosyltransferase involved in cell wall biosynthesis